MDGYVTDGEPKEITVNGSKYKIQCFQGDHEDEYVLKKDRKVCLFQNGVLKMFYEEEEEADGAQVGEFTRFENGCVAFVQLFDDLLDNRNFNRIVNHENGERLEIYSHDSGKLIYHGESITVNSTRSVRKKDGESNMTRNQGECCWREYGREINWWKSSARLKEVS